MIVFLVKLRSHHLKHFGKKHDPWQKEQQEVSYIEQDTQYKLNKLTKFLIASQKVAHFCKGNNQKNSMQERTQ